MSAGYKEPSPVLKRLFLLPKDPSLTLSSNYEWLVVTQEPPLPGIALLSRPEEKLAGIRFDPSLLAPSRMQFAESLVLQRMETGEKQGVDLPGGSEGIRYIRFHPTRPRFVYSSKVKDEDRFELHVCTLDDATGLWSADRIDLGEGRRMNHVNGCAYQFTSDGSMLLVKVVPAGWPSSAPAEPASTGPSVQEVTKGARKAPGRTYQDLLRNVHDEDKLRHYTTTELLCVDTTSLAVSSVVQSEGGKIFQSISSSPCGRHLLVQSTTKFSYSVPIRRFGKDVEIWDLQSSESVLLESVPVDDEVPLSYDACSRHPRSFKFHPGRDSTTVLYVKARDGGDPETDPVDGERDAVYAREILSEKGGGNLTASEPVKFAGLEWRYSRLDFTDRGLCVLEEYRWKDRMERKWLLHPDGKMRMLWERTWEDRYNSPGEFLSRRCRKTGRQLIVQPTETSMYLEGAGASELGDRPFLDLLDFTSEEKTTTTRLWRCAAPVKGDLDASKEAGGKIPTERKDVYEDLICLLYDNETIMISRECKTTPRNYHLTKLSESRDEVQITSFEHPQPDLLGVTKELVQYKRDDGVDLTANLYLPSNYDGTPRPTLFWAYPREFKNAKAAGQVKGSKHRFVSAHWASPVHWAAKGWVVMDDFSLPVVGEGDALPNDTFVEQIIAGATAAVNYVSNERKVTDPDRCAVGGHSYGSFMTAHLLSHTSLFAAGIGRSGAFNRTLTPMGFQSEDRSLWEATDTYITMSPLIHAEKYSKQDRVGRMLLIHGEADENSGTFCMQSERYFAALRAFGIESRLVLLPLERHSYRARESILHMAHEMEEWLRVLEDPVE